ncbi:MAG: hypothetical protein IJR00_02160, partial [Lachnospiraceae bacterium]|nr:hypothetical protein [Lachnospiraceae bacterium]
MRKRKRIRILAIGLILMMLAGVLAGALTVFAQEPAGAEQTAPPEAPEANPPEPPEPPETADSAETDAPDGEDAEAGSGESLPEETIITLVGKYDSADTAPVVRINEAARTITFRNHDLGRNYTLNYDETTRFLDPLGKETGMSHLAPGDLVDVTFLKSSKHLNSLQPAFGERVFSYTGLREYKLPVRIGVGASAESMANIRGSKYLLDLRTLVLVNGVESSVSSILEGDELTVVGADREIYAVTVTRGHGYLSLSSDTVGDASLVGAWIQLDHSIIRKITPQMLMAAPEGEYTLNIIGNGADYSTTVTITRGRETVVDTSGIPIEPPKTGNIKFEITPADAELRIDGSVADKEQEMALTYGIHTVELNASGYVTMLRYLKVGSERAVVRLGMERDTSAQTDTGDSGTGATAGASATDTVPGNVVSEVSLVSTDSSATDTTDSSGTGATDNGQTDGTGATDTTGATTDTSGTGATARDGNTDNTQQ